MYKVDQVIPSYLKVPRYLVTDQLAINPLSVSQKHHAHGIFVLLGILPNSEVSNTNDRMHALNASHSPAYWIL